MTTAQLDQLEAIAEALRGCREERCQIAMANVYQTCGLLPAGLEIPSGPRAWARAHGRSLIEPWVDGCGYFQRIDAIEPGALLGFRLGHTLHHVAIALRSGRMLHVMGAHGVQIAAAIPDEWMERLARIWRVKA